MDFITYNNRNLCARRPAVLAQGCKPIHWNPYKDFKKNIADKLRKSCKNIHGKLHLLTVSGLFTLEVEQQKKPSWNNYISMVLWACLFQQNVILQ